MARPFWMPRTAYEEAQDIVPKTPSKSWAELLAADAAKREANMPEPPHPSLAKAMGEAKKEPGPIKKFAKAFWLTVTGQ